MISAGDDMLECLGFTKKKGYNNNSSKTDEILIEKEQLQQWKVVIINKKAYIHLFI